MPQNAPNRSGGTGNDAGGLAGSSLYSPDVRSAAVARAIELLSRFRERDRLIGNGHMVSPSWEILLMVFSGGYGSDLLRITGKLGLQPSAGERWAAILIRDGLIAADPDAGENAYAITAHGEMVLLQTLA